jgi:chemotaxis protein methyltransferase CheR
MAGPKKSEVEILATDLNSKSLQKASAGIYGAWSFRTTPPLVRSAYFEMLEGNLWAVSPAVKKMVRFAQLNLMDDFFPPLANSDNGFDVIFCRNVLMYFTPAGRRKVVQQLYRALASDGWLVVSPAETSHELFSEFATVALDDVTLYRKPATPLRETLTLPSVVRDSEPAMAAVDDTSQKNQDHQVHAGTAEPPAPSYGQALALYERGRYEEAQQILGTLLSQNGNDAQAMLLLARAYANQGKLAAALAWCDKAIAADKTAARAYYLQATILLEQGSLPEALFALKQTVYADPQFVLAHFSLGNLALTQGKLRESEKHFESVLLLLAQYEPADIVPESEGFSAGRLREILVARGGVAPIVPGTELSQPTFGGAGKPRIEQVRRR